MFFGEPYWVDLVALIILAIGLLWLIVFLLVRYDEGRCEKEQEKRDKIAQEHRQDLKDMYRRGRENMIRDLLDFVRYHEKDEELAKALNMLVEKYYDREKEKENEK